MTSPERRANPRFACDLQASIEIEGLEPVPARTADISFSGICLLSEREVPSGSTAIIGVQLVTDGFHSDMLPLRANVVWCTKMRDAFQVGARFDPNMEDERWSKLDVLIRFLNGEISVDQDEPPS